MNTSKNRGSLSHIVVDHPWKMIATCIVMVIGIGYFMQFVRPSVSYKDMLGASNPQLKNYEHIQREYTNDDNLLFLIEAKNGDAFQPEILKGVTTLTQALWKTPYSIRVDSVTNFQHTEADGDTLTVADLVPADIELSQERIEKIKFAALSEPLVVNRVVNDKGDVLAINVCFAFPNKDAMEKLKANRYVQSLADAFQADFPQTNVYVGGLVALDATVMDISMRESGLFLGLVILMAIVLLILLLKVVTPIIGSVAVLLFSVVAGVAFSGLMGWKLTPFTSSVPLIILIIAVADCVHLITSYVQHLNAGCNRKEAVHKALRTNFKPIIITSATTAIGFLTMNFSESGSIRALGNQSAFGVMFACILSVTFLPAILSLLPAKMTPRRRKTVKINYDRLVDWLYEKRFIVLFLSIVLTALLGSGIMKNEFNDRIPTYFSKNLPWRQANDFSEEQFGGAYTFSFSIDSQRSDGVSDPAYLAKVEAFAEWLKSLPQSSYVNSITDTFKRLNKNLHKDSPEYYRLPDRKDLSAQYLLLYEMSLPYGLDLNDQINMDKSATKVLAAFKTMSTAEVLALESKINGWLSENMADMKVTWSGVQLMFSHLLDSDTRGLTMGAVYGLFAISFFLIFMIRSVKIGILSLFPNIMPVLLAFGVWGLSVGQVGMGLAMVSGMAIGVIVDDTVHFLHKYIKAKKEDGLGATEAVSSAYKSVGTSIFFTTVVLIAGFLTMAFLSEFRVNADMGKMTAIILVFALLFDLITLPVILMIFDRSYTIKKEAVYES